MRGVGRKRDEGREKTRTRKRTRGRRRRRKLWAIAKELGTLAAQASTFAEEMEVKHIQQNPQPRCARAEAHVGALVDSLPPVPSHY